MLSPGLISKGLSWETPEKMTKKEIKKMIKLAEKEIKEWQKFKRLLTNELKKR
jgi:hypothetical protein